MTAMHWVNVAGAVLFAYLCGAFPVGVLVARRYGVDIRRHGSGNIGFTNVLRVLGWKPGLLVFALDVAKGMVPVLVARRTCCAGPPASGNATIVATVAAATIIGHSFSVFLRFGGGKGVSTTLGAALGVHAPSAGLAFLLWLTILGAWRYVSLGSMIAVAAVPVFLVVFHQPREYVSWGIGITVLSLLRHWDNIGRLLRGEERKLGRREESADGAGATGVADQQSGGGE